LLAQPNERSRGSKPHAARVFSADGLVLRRQSWAKPRRAPARGTLPYVRLLQLAVPFGTPGDPARRLQSGLHVTLSNARITTGNPPSTLHGIFGGPLERVQEHTPRETLHHIQVLHGRLTRGYFGEACRSGHGSRWSPAMTGPLDSPWSRSEPRVQGLLIETRP
jgi:hypothetical protein